jgi:hypothetical protein
MEVGMIGGGILADTDPGVPAVVVMAVEDVIWDDVGVETVEVLVAG